MHTVTWTLSPNEGTSRQDIEYELEASKADYAGAAGLVRVMLGFSADNRSVIEISLWESKSAADNIFFQIVGDESFTTLAGGAYQPSGLGNTIRHVVGASRFQNRLKPGYQDASPTKRQDGALCH